MVYLDPEQLKAQKGRFETPAPTPDVYERLVGVGSSGHADVADEHDARLALALTRDHLR